MIEIRINEDHLNQGKVNSLRTNNSTIPLMQHDLSDLRLLILFNLDHLPGLQITAGQWKMSGDKSLNGQTICPVIYTGKENI